MNPINSKKEMLMKGKKNGIIGGIIGFVIIFAPPVLSQALQ